MVYCTFLKNCEFNIFQNFWIQNFQILLCWILLFRIKNIEFHELFLENINNLS